MAFREELIPWDQQPQEDAQPHHDAFPLTRLSLPAVNLRDLVTGRPPTTTGTPTSEGIFAAPCGLVRQAHPSGGANGYQGWFWGPDDGITESNDATLIFVGVPQNTATANGGIMFRGRDGAGSGWGLRIVYESGNLIGGCVTTSPTTGFTATIASPGHSVGDEQRIALIKRGTTLTILDWRTRRSATVTTGAGPLRTSTEGLRAGGSTSLPASGHHQYALMAAMPVGLADEVVWGVLDNPWQLFRPRSIWVPAAAGGGGGVVAALTLQASGEVVFNPAAGADARKVYLTAAGSLAARLTAASGDRLVSMAAGQLQAGPPA